MNFSDKYRHIGYSYPGVPKGWIPVVEKTLIEIEKRMWPQWMPLFLKRWIHYLATGNSVVRIKYRWAHKLRNLLTGGQMIMDVKDKYASLRIYGHVSDEIHQIIDNAEQVCENTCENCGGNDDVQMTGTYWVNNFCKNCRIE